PAPTALAVGAGTVWIATQDERLLRLDPATGAGTGSLSLPATVIDTVVGSGVLWALVTLGTGQIWRVDPEAVSTAGTTSVTGYPVELAIDGHEVWVAEFAGIVQRIDATTGEIDETTRVGFQPEAVAVGEDVWVAVGPVS